MRLLFRVFYPSPPHLPSLGDRFANAVIHRYGDEKPAPEMVFSYGFLDSGTTSARQILLNLDIPRHDPLQQAKKVFIKDDIVPGIRLSIDPSGIHTHWDSPYVWWVCIMEEDGLDFDILQTTHGEKELRATWKGEDIGTGSGNRLRDCLAEDPLWDVFQLRAVVVILQRLEEQLSLLQQVEDVISDVRHNEGLLRSIFRMDVFDVVCRLRSLEASLLVKGIDDLVNQVCDILFVIYVPFFFFFFFFFWFCGDTGDEANFMTEKPTGHLRNSQELP